MVASLLKENERIKILHFEEGLMFHVYVNDWSFKVWTTKNISKDQCLMIWWKWLYFSHVFLLLYFEYLFGICRQKILKNYGVIECDPLVLAGMDKSVSW